MTTDSKKLEGSLIETLDNSKRLPQGVVGVRMTEDFQTFLRNDHKINFPDYTWSNYLRMAFALWRGHREGRYVVEIVEPEK